MALTFGFYNSISGDRVYDALQFGQIFDGIITDGVYATFKKGMVVKASDNAGEVIIQPGRAWFNHTWTFNDADYIMTAPSAPLLLNRIDALVLDINGDEGAANGRTNSFQWVQGTESAEPAKPTLINTNSHHQYPLAYIKRYPETVTIKTADITSAIGTSECPFAAGVLKGIDLDAWINQWDAAFNDWYRDVRTEFEVWMATEQIQYETWFEVMQNQMEGDLETFEAWFQTIQGIIDSDAATHLQQEIDAINAKLPSGSVITVTTPNTELHGMNVTVSDGTSSKTVKFNNSGVAKFESVAFTGNLTISSTDGIQTATNTLNVPYYGVYETEISFWSATVMLDGDQSLSGIVVTVKDSNNVVVKYIPLSTAGKGEFQATKADTYKFVYSYEGTTYEPTLAVTSETTYTLKISGAPDGSTVTPVNDIQIWLHCAKIWDKDYTTIAQVVNDGATFNTLVQSANAVNYMVRSTGFASAVAANGSSMAVIGTNEYCSNALLANTAWCNAICNSTYFENVLTTRVPVMTSDTVPRGLVFYSSQTDNGASTGHQGCGYHVFDSDDSGLSIWMPAEGRMVAGEYVGYKFVSKPLIKRIRVYAPTGSGTNGTMGIKYRIEASNDNINWTTLHIKTTWTTESDTAEVTVLSNNNTKYQYYRLYVTDVVETGSRPWYSVKDIQFWGRG